MKFKLQITPGLYSQNQHQKPMSFDFASGYPEMSCFDYEGIPKSGATYPSTKEKEVNIRISMPTSDEISWGITKKHRFNEYAKGGAGKGVTIIPVEYSLNRWLPARKCSGQKVK